MHCCVIGGSGFIGQHLVKALVKQGKDITIIDKEKLPSIILPSNIHYVAGDYGDKNFLFNTLKGVDEIIDLAYASVPKTSFEDPVNDIINNLPPSVNLFEVASSLPIKKIVIVSSGGTVYGKAIKLPISENHPTDPISPYGITKLAIEKYASMYHKFKNLPIVCLRPANAYGEGQKPFVNQGFVATAIASALTEREINIFGKEGTVRDFVYVKDVAEGIAAALNQCPPGERYNIGTGIGTSNQDVLNIIAAIAELDNIALRVKILPARSYDVPVNILDSSKLINATDWSPKIALKKGIELTWEYFKELYKK